ncbi:hypothetical protein E2562_037410 [Oryza meyeriana var. granulata]|uniref:Uncharacterized protein n=1 Tax=Oryza meyeriana var. granulata TaxID=110450 RepID=A0A6G1ECI8_9ORYZ|nr:hypothetical protein E2562_037410 [Oryza meyeriana var. granulata]
MVYIVCRTIQRTLIAHKGAKEGVTVVMQWVLYHLFNRECFDIVDLMLVEMEDAIYSAIKRQLPHDPYLFALLLTAELVDIVSYRMLPCTINSYSPASATYRRHRDRALPMLAAGVPATDCAEEGAHWEDIPSSLLVYDVSVTVLYRWVGIRQSLAAVTLSAQFFKSLRACVHSSSAT